MARLLEEADMRPVVVTWARSFPDRDWAFSVHPFRWVVLNEARLTESTRADVWDTLIHEAAHLDAWDRHGLEIQDHGPEWRASFARLALCKDEIT